MNTTNKSKKHKSQNRVVYVCKFTTIVYINDEKNTHGLKHLWTFIMKCVMLCFYVLYVFSKSCSYHCFVEGISCDHPFTSLFGELRVNVLCQLVHI